MPYAQMFFMVPLRKHYDNVCPAPLEPSSQHVHLIPLFFYGIHDFLSHAVADMGTVVQHSGNRFDRYTTCIRYINDRNVSHFYFPFLCPSLSL